VAVSPSSLPGAVPARASLRRRPLLYVFSPLPPQRNGLADYMAEYLPHLAQDFDLHLVVEAGLQDTVAEHFAGEPSLTVIDEVQFLARQSVASAPACLYNIGNNSDCAWLLEHALRFPGVVIVHDISLFYLHQVVLQESACNPDMGQLLKAEHYAVPEDFMARDGGIALTPGLIYQECLMLRRLVGSARGVMVHTAYAERRLRAATEGLPLGAAQGRPLARIPHFILPAPEPTSAEDEQAVLDRFAITADDFVLLVPGFLSGNKMLYEVMVACHALQDELPGLKLIYAGEERASEYALSPRLAQLWPQGGGPLVTGYLDAADLDALLRRADVSFLLRFPTYGESSGLLPRAAMGGGEVITVDIGAYPELQSPQVQHVSVGPRTVAELCEGVRQAHARRAQGAERAQRRALETERFASHSPAALYPQLLQWLQQSLEVAS
jgi:glycosyltransferase involved in cell wall biosynthesis